MGWFGLDPYSITQRVLASNKKVAVPTLARSVLHGVIGFTVVSVAGFSPWVLAGKWFYKNPGELVMYASCAAVFLILSGLLLHPLIIGPGSLKRFYAFFGVAFLAYSIGWIGGWMGLSGYSSDVRSLVGLFAGTLVMAVMFTLAFEARRMMLFVLIALFVLNSLGYFVGGWIEGALAQEKQVVLLGFILSGSKLTIFMKMMWGVCYGIGFGAGLGISFYIIQFKARAMLLLRGRTDEK